MAFTLNTVDLFTGYAIRGSQAPGSNIALEGCYDLPARQGKTHHLWGDDNSLDPHVAAGDMMFAGRDITFHGIIIGERTVINTKLQALRTAVLAFTGLVNFVTPYGTFSVYVKDIHPTYYNGAAKVRIVFREPVVTLSGTLPAADTTAASTIDGIPFASFGLYLTKAEALHALPEMKEQMFTKYASEGYQMAKRKNKTLEFRGFVLGSSLADFTAKIAALYELFSASGTRNIKINHEVNADCFAASGFEVENMILAGVMIASFKADLLCVNVNNISVLTDESGETITMESGELIYI
jgi:hypothetical protein